MSQQILFVSRLFGVVAYAYSIYYQHVHPNPLIQLAWGIYKYLTFWDLCLQFVFFTVLFFSQSVFRIRSKAFVRFQELIFYSLAFPVSVIVAGTFWGLYAINRDLIFPVEVEKYYPVWLNHSSHTLIVALTAIELVLAGHRTPSSKSGLTVLISFNAVYLGVLLYLNYTYDIWVYPFLRVLNWPQRIVFFTFSLLFNIFAFYIGTVIAKSQGFGSSAISAKVAKQQKSKKHK